MSRFKKDVIGEFNKLLLAVKGVNEQQDKFNREMVNKLRVALTKIKELEQEVQNIKFPLE